MANRSNVMGLHGLKNKPSRNSFDLSHRNLFTAKVGELLPCFVQELNPGDSIKVNTSYFTRTAPLQTAAFTRLRENVQFFFVPYSCLWKYFNQQVLNMTTNASGQTVSRVADSLTSSQKVTTKMPYVSYNALHSYLYYMINDSVSYNDPKSRLYLYGTYRHAETAKLLQLLGYGNFREQFAKFNHDASDKLTSDTGATHSPNLSVFRLLAYQKICNDHYIYSQWQPYRANLCNVDYLSPSSSALDMSAAVTSLSQNGNNNSLNFLDMRFSNLPLDYFNGVLPTPQFGTESVARLNINASSRIATTSQQPSPRDGSTVMGANYAPLTGVSLSSDSSGKLIAKTSSSSSVSAFIDSPHFHDVSFDGLTSELSVSVLRNAIALQKYKEIQLASDVDFVSQVQAHFGVTPKHEDDKSVFIGGSSSMIDINPVINTNLQTPSSPTNGLPTVKAAPTGNGSASIKFTADTYGVVIGIYRCTPVLDYAHTGIDRTLFKTDASDFVIPELDSIGMQTTYNCELYAPSLRTSSDKLTYDLSLSYGYAPRYAEYKTSYDRYNGAFCNSLASWVTGMNSSVLSSWGSQTSISVPDLFICRPDIVGNIFLLTTFHTSDDDPLYVGLVNMCYATRNLSTYGLPYSK